MSGWIVLAACLLLSVAWNDLLAIQGRSPDLLLLGVLWAGRQRAPWQAALLGFTVGMGLDLAAGQDPLGASALAATSAGFFAARLLPAHSRLHPLLILGRAALVLAPLELFLAQLRFRGMDYSAWAVAWQLALPVWAYTLTLFLLLAWLPGGRDGRGR